MGETDGGRPRLRINRDRTIPFQYAQCKDTGRIDALRLAWKPGDEPVPHIFWDSDVAKWIEAASYSLGLQFATQWREGGLDGRDARPVANTSTFGSWITRRSSS